MLSVDAVYDWCVQPQCGAVVLFSGTVRDHAVDGSGSVRDGVEHLIPNETLISERVENWTHTHSRTRLKLDVGVHYDSDLHHVIAMCEEAARATARVLAEPAPKCLFMEFGESSLNLQVRFWIADAQNGVQNVKSEVLLRIWETFRQRNVEVPYPQRDLHIRSSSVAFSTAPRSL